MAQQLFALVAVITAALLLPHAHAITAEQGGGPKVATVLHTPVNLRYGETVDSIIDSNLARYFEYAVAAKSDGAGLILYPESGTGYLQVPLRLMHLFCEPIQPLDWSAPITDRHCASVARLNATATPHAHFASCLAREMAVDVVINYCGKNASNGKYYNVDVAFRAISGAVAAVYRKSHITATGPVLSQPAEPDVVTFTATSGVTFGLFTCYDFWFVQPQFTEIKALGVNHFLFPSEMAAGQPYFTTTSTAAGWSGLYNATVVGASSFGTGFTGVVSQGAVVNALQPMPANFTDGHAVIVTALPPLSTSRTATMQTSGIKKSAVTAAAAGAAGITLTRSLPAPSTQRCMYGPSKNSALNFTYPCSVVQPTPGGRYNFDLTNEVDGYEVSCEGTLEISADQADDTEYIFGAVLVLANPSESTPSTSATAMCLLSRCPGAPQQSCMTMDLFAGWDASLRVTSASMRIQLGGRFVTSGKAIDMYPSAVLANGANGTATSRPIEQYVIPTSETNGSSCAAAALTADPNSCRAMSIHSWSTPLLDTMFLWSLGFYADQLIGTWSSPSPP